MFNGDERLNGGVCLSGSIVDDVCLVAGCASLNGRIWRPLYQEVAQSQEAGRDEGPGATTGPGRLHIS